MKNYELFYYNSVEEGAVKMILSYAIDNYSEYTDEDISNLYEKYLKNKIWLGEDTEV